MIIEIRKLTAMLTNDYLNFFDMTPHWDNVDEQKCYCVCWCSADHRTETDFSSAEIRRDLAAQYIQKGLLQGYLAYYKGQVVGWCNANTKSNCLNCISWLRFMQPVNTGEADPNNKVKSVFCFMIAPAAQRKGVATRLLERVIIDATNDGFELIETYPKKDFVSLSRDFMGPAAMYKKFGFTVYLELDNGISIMRKRLKFSG